MENDLFNMFRHMNMGTGNPTEMMAQLLQQYEISILQMLRGMIDQRLKEMGINTRRQPTGGIPDDMNPFSILGVSMDATEREVRDAYRKKAAEFHPDKGGTNEEMAKINAAYEVVRKFRGWK